ncbi:hypothetical protein S820908_012 [Synechococcus phage S-CAM9]|uniref:Uncharacterized protein n=1 Tax=Synechococcus phage S-CAM9 TaxID=1883369 RepID=A0A1D8KPM3_9CAUD|nr:hypothetical protein BOW85_gp012 [Synechococcus phage S-CAM9]AOV60159.1 hypothetical protein S050808_012 [Synechococcus phage S-CAM9]AOV60387.1 hypothetical protein S820908_012 [Synechococcus phage S-CAM9]AOV60615.1 hypothetical protein N161109_012 [Synechococcus phage S-CAM9]
MDIFQSQRFTSSLNGLSGTTERLARVMKNDARVRKADFKEISRLNDRLNRVIPIIPGMFGIAGATFGLGVDDGGLFGLPTFPKFGLPPLPPGPPPPPGSPGPPTPPRSPVPTPPPPLIAKEEDERSAEANRRRQEDAKRRAEDQRNRRGVPTPATVPATPSQKPGEKEKEAEPDREAEPGREPITIPNPPPPPIPLTPAIPRRRRKKEKEEEKELVPTALTEYQFELALRARREKEKGADPAWLGPYYSYLNDYFVKTGGRKGGAVELPDGGVLTMNVVGGLFSNRRPLFKYYNGIDMAKTKKNTKTFMDVMNIIQAVFAVMGPFAGARRPTTQPGKTTPTVQDPNYRQPKGEPAVPLPQPGSVIVPTKPGGPLVKPAPQPAPQPVSGQTIDVTPTQRVTSQSGQTTIFGQGGRKIQKSLPGSVRSGMAEYNRETLINLLKKSYKDNINRVRKTPTQNELDIKDALRQQGIEPPTPAELGIGPQASARTLIKPIYILTDKIA